MARSNSTMPRTLLPIVDVFATNSADLDPDPEPSQPSPLCTDMTPEVTADGEPEPAMMIHCPYRPSVVQELNVSLPTSELSASVLRSTDTDSVPSHSLLMSESSSVMEKKDVDVILDPNTAYPKLILSKDGKQVRHGGTWTDVPNNPERFDSSACVLGKDGFSCGKFYYEVEVGEKMEWDLVTEKKNETVNLRSQHGSLTEISKIKTSKVQTEGKIYFTLGKTDCSTPSTKRVGMINEQVKVSRFGAGTSPLADLSLIQKLYEVYVILDPNTAYPKLILSKDRKQVRHGGTWTDVPNNPERFDSSACVLGMDGFSCGRFYFEVQVSDKTEWDLGMARESIRRKGKIRVCPENGFWCIWLRNGCEYMANESCPLSLKDKPQKVGLFVDYEEGLVSFYNVETKALIYSFTGLSFTERIYPFFSPCNKIGDMNSKPLIISTVNKSNYPMFL
ncbi:Nuclear factor 7, ovary [Anabarilius grahami]|uniref:Nuclear factor 7, ovary n=1 Tax=Anabarilius grahami TaxID=495550 RepID=A0A3N0XSX1_ANAGA|nr:Nuclear factor 7, ovary [Anabarilius grahami]